VDAHPEADRQPGTRQFLDDLKVGFVGLLAAAELGRIRQAEQPGPAY